MIIFAPVFGLGGWLAVSERRKNGATDHQPANPPS
jgi:hypothetical protein